MFYICYLYLKTIVGSLSILSSCGKSRESLCQTPGLTDANYLNAIIWLATIFIMRCLKTKFEEEEILEGKVFYSISKHVCRSFRLQKSEKEPNFRTHQKGWTYYDSVIHLEQILNYTKHGKNKSFKNICLDSYPFSSMKRMFCWVHRYSTVGVRVPIWRLRMLLKIWATSFLPC